MNYKAIPIAPLFIGLGSGLFILTGQPPEPPAIFTAAQAEAGRIAYENTCGKCHTPSMLGRKGDPGELPPIASLSADYQKFIGSRGTVPPLAGPVFLSRWGSKTAAQVIARFQVTAGDPFFKFEGMDDQTTVNIAAYALQVSGAKAGTRPLTKTTDVVVSSVIR
jgi:cytochrome c